LLGKAVLSQLRETFGSAFTEDEGKRLIELEGNYGKSPEANLRILTNVLTMLERRYEVGVMAAETSGDTDAIYGMRKFREPLVDDGTTGTTSVDNQSLDTPVQLIGSEDEADAQYNNLDPGQLYTDTNGDQKRKPR
jgi:hypothetical protein